MIVSHKEMREFFDDIDDSEYDIVYQIHVSIEDYVGNYCNRTFGETAYSKEKYDGKNYRIINLKNYPIISVDRVSIGILDVIKVCNTASATTASVSVTTNGLRLVKDGTADITVTFADHTTMTTLVAAVNALGNSWSAGILSSTYSSYKSTELIKRWGLSCIDTNWAYLKIPDDGEDDFEVYEDRGQVYLHGKFPKGKQNVFVDYSAGYSVSDMPEDLKLLVKILTKYFFQKRDEETWGTSSFKVNEITTHFEKGNIPKEASMILNRYRRRSM